ncbi:hypothetical protein KAW38_01645 [Candidatus Micrarchaeota archaeon]|nr:hypothetical protein [Candidatus Micrarchaeota archaeon]
MEDIILPGEKLWDKEIRINNTFIENGETYAAVVGMKRGDRFIPLENAYSPKFGDNMIGIVIEEKRQGFNIDINLASRGFISARNTRIQLMEGDFIYGKIDRVDEFGAVDIGEFKRLSKGRIMEVPPSKVPRIIGKKFSMVDLVEDKTGCQIYVGNNGYIWIGEGKHLPLAIASIEKIIKEAHIPGLTDRITKYLEKNR